LSLSTETAILPYPFRKYLDTISSQVLRKTKINFSEMKPFDNKYVKRKMTMRELTKITGYTARQVRYLIAEGFVPSPEGGRANAEYGEVHVSAVKRYQLLREAGFSPASIRLLMKSQTGVPFQVIPGISLMVDPHLLAERLPIADVDQQIKSLLDRIFSTQDKPHSND